MKLILTHLLAPRRCKIVTVVTVFVTISSSVVSDNFSGTLVHGISVRHVSCGAIFCFGLVIDVSLCVLLFFISPTVDTFFERPILISIVEIVNFILVMGTLTVVPHAVFVQGVGFGARAGISLVTSVDDNIINVKVTLSKVKI